MSKKLSLLFLLAAISLLGTTYLNAQYKIEKQVIGSGGYLAARNSSNYEMSGLVGQVAIFRTSGLYNSKTWDVFQGFWVPKDQLISGVDDNTSSAVKATNFPNPFANMTTIRYELPAPAIVALKVYDLTGNLVKVIFDGFQESGIQNVTWDAKDNTGLDVTSGSYIYEITANPAGGSSFSSFRVRNMMIIAK